MRRASQFQISGRGVLKGAAWLAGSVLAAGAWLGCSVEHNYKLLSFFFDGVPDPNAPQVAQGPGGAPVDIRQSPTYSVHRPYANDQCSECHAGKQVRLGSKNSAMCMKCHEAKMSEHAVMHGPVAAGACLWCHGPHESAYAVLFKGPPQQVCTQCHTPQMLESEHVPEHADASVSCLDCHFGHGGDRRFFMKPGAKSKGPSAAPGMPAKGEGSPGGSGGDPAGEGKPDARSPGLDTQGGT